MTRRWVTVGRLGVLSNDHRRLRDVYVPGQVPVRSPQSDGALQQLDDGTGALHGWVALRVSEGWIEAALLSSWGEHASIGLSSFSIEWEPCDCDEHDSDTDRAQATCVLDGTVGYVIVGPGMGHAWTGQPWSAR